MRVMGAGAVLYLENRGDPGPGGVIDFDGTGVREITLVEGPVGPGRRWWIFSVDRPVPDLDGQPMSRVALADRHAGGALEGLLQRSEGSDHPVARVYVSPVGGSDPKEYTPLYWGEVTRSPSDQLRNPFDLEPEFAALDAYVAREGHADVGLSEVVDGVDLGWFVDRMRESEVAGGLDTDTRDRLSAYPGWRWYESDSIGLLADYAAREGTSYVPHGHLEQGRFLWVAVRSLAELYALAKAGKVVWPTRDAERLEALPGWSEAVAAYEREVSADGGFGTRPLGKPD